MKTIIFTDVCLKKGNYAGNINAIKSLHNYLKNRSLVKLISQRDFNNGFVSLVMIFSLMEIKIRNIIFVKFNMSNSKNTALTVNYSYILLCFFYIYLRVHKYDFFIIEYIHFSYLKRAAPKYTRVMLDTHDIQFLRRKSFIKERAIITPYIDIEEQEELKVLSYFYKVIVIQIDEYHYLKDNGLSNLVLSPRPSKIVEKSKFRKGVIGFVGGRAQFNKDGIIKFINDIWIEKSNLTLNIYGLVCTTFNREEIKIISRYSNINIMGPIDTIENIYQEVQLIVNPVYYGSGLKTKNVEALCHGTPLLTTTIGAQGLTKFNMKGMFIFNTRDEFWNKVTLLLKENEYFKYSKMAYQESKLHFSDSACFDSLFEEMRLD